MHDFCERQGHTDIRTTMKYNDMLSDYQAKRLTRHGVGRAVAGYVGLWGGEKAK